MKRRTAKQKEFAESERLFLVDFGIDGEHAQLEPGTFDGIYEVQTMCRGREAVVLMAVFYYLTSGSKPEAFDNMGQSRRRQFGDALRQFADVVDPPGERVA